MFWRVSIFGINWRSSEFADVLLAITERWYYGMVWMVRIRCNGDSNDSRIVLFGWVLMVLKVFNFRDKWAKVGIADVLLAIMERGY